MFNWHSFFGGLLISTALCAIVGIIAGGIYMMGEMDSAWGFALAVGGIVLGSIACGFNL